MQKQAEAADGPLNRPTPLYPWKGPLKWEALEAVCILHTYFLK